MNRRIAADVIALFALCVCVKADEPTLQKLAVPMPDAQEKALKLISEIYKSDFQHTQATAEKSRFAKKLLQVGIDTTNDPAGRFVLLRLARDTAAEAGDSEVALAAITELDRRFNIEILPMQVEVCTSIDKALKSPKDCGTFVRQFIPVLQQAPDADQYQLATAIADCLLKAARKGGDAVLLKDVVARRQQVDQLAKEFAIVADALTALSKTPADPAANLVVGHFRCFVQGDWDRGLPYLALSSDEKLRVLATRELSPPTADEGQMKLGDDYWDFAETLKGTQQQRLRERACHWYRIAAPTLNGLAKAKVEQQLGQMKLASPAEALDVRRIKVEVKPKAAFLRDIEKQFPHTANKARHGNAVASSYYDSDRTPDRIFRGIRADVDSWVLKGTKGWLRATWSDPPNGRFIVIFGRGTAKGNDSWGKSSVSVNGGAPVAIQNLSGSDVAIIDLQGQFDLRVIEISIDGKDNSGIIGLEIH